MICGTRLLMFFNMTNLTFSDSHVLMLNEFIREHKEDDNVGLGLSAALWALRVINMCINRKATSYTFFEYNFTCSGTG